MNREDDLTFVLSDDSLIKGCGMLRDTFRRPFGFLRRLDDIYVIKKYEIASVRITLPSLNNLPVDCYPILYADVRSLFHLPLFYYDTIQRYIVLTDHFWEFDLLSRFIDLVLSRKSNEKLTYFDIGANIGNHSVFFSKFGNADNVFSFEPQRFIFSVLKKNMLINSVKGNIFNTIVSSESANFYIAESPPRKYRRHKI